MSIRTCLLLTAALSLGALTPAPVVRVEGMKEVFQHDRTFIAGQPSLEMLRAFKAQGVGLVVNLREDKEIKEHAATAFQEEALVKELGMAYLWLPVGEKGSYTPAVVDRLEQTLKGQGGKVLIHCASGYRATWVYMAHLVRAGSPLDQAVIVGKQMKFIFPVEELLGNSISMRIDEK